MFGSPNRHSTAQLECKPGMERPFRFPVPALCLIVGGGAIGYFFQLIGWL